MPTFVVLSFIGNSVLLSPLAHDVTIHLPLMYTSPRCLGTQPRFYFCFLSGKRYNVLLTLGAFLSPLCMLLFFVSLDRMNPTSYAP